MTIFSCRFRTGPIRLLAVTLFLALAVRAADTGRVEGIVIDPSGSAVVGARVALLKATGVAHQARTNDQGRFAFNAVGEGDYTLAVESQGFMQSEKAFVGVSAGRTESVEVRLEIAAISDHVVVTATRTETPIDELGGAVSVIESEGLRRKSYSILSEPLRLVPGLSVARSGGRGGLTTIYARGGESDYNKVLIDGVPVNAAGGLFDFASLTPENIDRIEVTRGPQSALFGSDAMTSVIHLVTRRGTSPTPELELTGEGGSLDYHRETARLSGLSGWFDYSAGFGFQTTGGRFRNDDFTNRSASVNLGFRLAPEADLRITTRLNNNSLGVPGPTAVQFADPTQRQKHRDLAAAATLTLRSGSRWFQTGRFIYSEFDTLSFDPVGEDLSDPRTPVLAPGAFGNDFVFSFRDHQKRAGLHYQVVGSVNASNIITGGIDYEHETAVFDSDFSRAAPSRNNLGLYIQEQINLRDRFFLNAGVRVERNTGEIPEDLRRALASLGSGAAGGDPGYGLTVNPKLAASLLLRSHKEGAKLGATRLRGSFGSGIKEPSLVDAFSPSVFFLGNPTLDPERAISYDAGLVQELYNRRASVEVSYFDNRFRDLIYFIFDPETFRPITLPDGRKTSFINLERSSARGVELAATARPLLRLRVWGSYTFLRSRLEQTGDSFAGELGLPLIRRPRHSGAFEISWADQRFDLALDASLVGRRRDLDPVTGARFTAEGRPVYNDGYAKLNAAGSIHVSRFATLFARVENLLNQDYQEVLGYPAYRLNFSAGLRFRIGGRN